MKWQSLLFVILLISGVLAAVSIGERYAPPQMSSYSSRNKEFEGCLAFYLLLQKYTEVERIDVPLNNLESGTLLIIHPVRPLLSEEIEYLYQWVGQGNRLVVFSDDPQVVESFQVPLSESEDTHAVLPPVRDHWSTRNVESVDISYARYFSSHEDCALFQDENKPVVIELEEGEGQIFLASVTSILWNSNVAKNDNEIFLVQLSLADKVYFDEYHLYHLKKEGGIGLESIRIIFSSRYSLFFIQIIMAIAFLFVVHGKRFGVARPVIPEAIQSSELVVSAADLHYRAGKKEILEVIESHKNVYSRKIPEMRGERNV
jgi:hypothetical protein